MELDFSILRPQERLSLQLRMLYEKAGFQQYHMSRFEEYGLYQENHSFLSSEQLITFTDLDGRLLAMKPDVTLSIAKSARVEEGGCSRYYYLENVYRPSRENHTFQEISQMGLECIGTVDKEVTAQAVSLALQSLQLTGEDYALEISHMGFVAGLMDAAGVDERDRGRLLALIRDKNVSGVRQYAAEADLSAEGQALVEEMFLLHGKWDKVLQQAKAVAQNETMCQALEEIEAVCRTVEEVEDRLQIDFSLVNDMEYYNGLVLRGYLAPLPRPVLKGGRYDRLAQRFRPGIKAMGFALYLDELERLGGAEEEGRREMVNIALPKGRLGDKVYGLLADLGYGCEENYNDSRKLVVENREAGIRYFLVKPSDVAIYVEHGAADIGIVGKDILQESAPDVYELMDTGLGRCHMCVAAKEDFVDDPGKTLRVATKFVNIAKEYYAAQGREITIIRLNGSIELAPLLGLSDVIVDIVETGTTLRENRLQVVTKFMPISARLIANRASYQFKHQEIETIVERLTEVTKA